MPFQDARAKQIMVQELRVKGNFKISLLCLCSAWMTAGLIGSPASFSAERFFDKQCKAIGPAEQSFRQDQVFSFKSADQQGLLVLARYIDGSALVCVSWLGNETLTPLEAQEFQGEYIEKIEPHPGESVFMITVRKGNGWKVPMILYRLDLSTPGRPGVTKVKEWTSN